METLSMVAGKYFLNAGGRSFRGKQQGRGEDAY